METEWLILADAAQVVGGKLYLLGGGWDILTVNSRLPFVHSFGIAAAFSVPWNETNQPRDVQMEIQNEDGEVLLTAGFRIEVGRPAGIPLGQAQRAQIAANLGLEFQKVGGYVVVVRIEGQDDRRFPFRLVPGAAQAAQQGRDEGRG